VRRAYSTAEYEFVLTVIYLALQSGFQSWYSNIMKSVSPMMTSLFLKRSSRPPFGRAKEKTIMYSYDTNTRIHRLHSALATNCNTTVDNIDCHIRILVT
jgi:hypothetical protein